MSDEKDFMESLTDEERAEINAAGAEETTAETEEAGGETQAEATQEAAGDTQTQTDDQDDAAEQADPILPPLRAKAPDNADELMSQLAQEEEALAQKFDDGDITAREYRDSINKLNDQRDEIKWATREANLASKMQRQAEENAWHKEVQDFMTTTAAHITKSNAAMVAFDDIVKKVTADPANANLSNRAQLDKAFKVYNDEMAATFGIKQDQQPAAKADQAKAPAPKAQRVIPPTLAKVPAAETESLDGGKFANLDRLAAMDPAAYEAAVAKMSEAERSQFESVV